MAIWMLSTNSNRIICTTMSQILLFKGLRHNVEANRLNTSKSFGRYMTPTPNNQLKRQPTGLVKIPPRMPTAKREGKKRSIIALQSIPRAATLGWERIRAAEREQLALQKRKDANRALAPQHFRPKGGYVFSNAEIKRIKAAKKRLRTRVELDE